MLERRHQLPPPPGDELFALLVDERWDDVVLVEGGNFNLDSLDAVAADEADLGVAALLRLRWSKLKGDEPLDPRLEVPVVWVRRDVRNAQASESEARGVAPGVNPSDLLERQVAGSQLALHGSVVPGTHLRVWVVARVCQLVRSAHWVEELDGLVRARSDDELRLREVAYVDDRRVVCIDPLVEGHVPRRP